MTGEAAEDQALTKRERIAGIDAELGKHDEALKKAMKERARIVRSFEELKKTQAQQIKEKMEELWADEGDTKALEEMYKLKQVNPKLSHAQESISKLDIKCEWHRVEKRRLAAERRQIEQTIQAEDQKRCCGEVVSQFEKVSSLIKEAQVEYGNLLHAIQNLKDLCRNSHPIFMDVLTSSGAKPWIYTLADSYMRQLQTADLLEFLSKVSLCTTQGNPFYSVTMSKYSKPFIRDTM